MRRDTLYYASVLALFGLVEPSGAFVSPSTTSQQRNTLALNLVPGQGNQLVAAFNAATCKKEAEGYEEQALPTITVGEAVARDAQDSPLNFVQRAFSLPSHKKHPHPKAEGLDTPATEKKTEQEKDVMYFPLVGFTFCKNGDRVIPLPTTSNVSCHLHNHRNQEVYGWFSPVCKLDLYAEDVCHPPEAIVEP